MWLLQIYLHVDRSPHLLPILPCGYYKFTFMSIDLHTCSLFFHAATTNLPSCRLVVYRSSETSINQTDVIIRSDDRLWSLVVDSDSIVSKIYMLNFVLWLVFFSVSILTKILQFYPSWFLFALILTNIWQFCPSVLLTPSQYTYLD